MCSVSRVPVLIAAGILLALAVPARADNPFLNSYRFRTDARPESGAEVAERIRAGSSGSGLFGHGRDDLQVSAVPVAWVPSPVDDDRQCARFCLVGVTAGRRSLRVGTDLIGQAGSLFGDLLDSRGGGADDGVWFWDGRGARRASGAGPGPGDRKARRTYFWDGTSAVLRMKGGAESIWEPGIGRQSPGGDLPEAEIFYWHGPDQAEVVRTTKFGLEAISGGAPAWFVSTSGYWEVHSWGGASSFQVTGDTAHQLFFTHGERTMTLMDGLSGDWEDDVNQLVDPSQWLLYLMRNRGMLEDLNTQQRRRR